MVVGGTRICSNARSDAPYRIKHELLEELKALQELDADVILDEAQQKG
jgi:hypothetical protein